MNFVLILALISVLSGLCIAENSRPGYCMKKFPITGEPEMVEVKIMDKLIQILRSDTLKKYAEFESEIERLKTLNEDCLINQEDLKDQNERIKAEVEEQKKKIKKLEDNILELNQRIEESDGLDQDGTQNIFEASKKGSLKGVKYWYKQDAASIHRKDGQIDNRTPLHYASGFGHIEIVNFLLSKEVDVNAVDYSFNATPLMLASFKGHVPVVEALLNKGAHINIRDKYKSTPLHWAVEGNQLAVVKVLIENDADKSIRNSDNKTPLDWARNRGDKHGIVDYLSSL